MVMRSLTWCHQRQQCRITNRRRGRRHKRRHRRRKRQHTRRNRCRVRRRRRRVRSHQLRRHVQFLVSTQAHVKAFARLGMQCSRSHPPLLRHPRGANSSMRSHPHRSIGRLGMSQHARHHRHHLHHGGMSQVTRCGAKRVSFVKPPLTGRNHHIEPMHPHCGPLHAPRHEPSHKASCGLRQKKSTSSRQERK